MCSSPCKCEQRATAVLWFSYTSPQRLNLDTSGVVRRTVSKPISIIRSTSVPAQLQDRSQGGDPEAGGGSGGKTTSRRGLHIRDRSLQHDFNTGGAGGLNGIVQSLPPPQAPLLAGSLPPSRFLDDLPPLCLGPQVCMLMKFGVMFFFPSRSFDTQGCSFLSWRISMSFPESFLHQRPSVFDVMVLSTAASVTRVPLHAAGTTHVKWLVPFAVVH